MGLNFRKSIKISKGVRVNFSKTGTSLSFGKTGARYTVGSNGRRTATVGIPGTGLYYSKQVNVKNKKTENSQVVKTKNDDKNLSVTFDNGETKIFTPQDVIKFNDYLEKVTHFHDECNEDVDWDIIENLLPPFQDGQIGPKEKAAKIAFENIKPNLFEKFNKSAFEKRKQKLFDDMFVAQEEDLQDYKDWQENVTCAKQVKEGNVDAYFEAILSAEPFVDLSEYGTDIEFGTDSPEYVEIEFCSKMDEIIPTDKITLTPKGKVSHSNFTKTDFYALCQDYVCSYSIRLARELFALLPVDYVIVHAIEKDGIFENQKTILSICFERELLNRVNFDKGVDASDLVNGCVSNMNFKKTSGFKEVDKLDKRVVYSLLQEKEDKKHKSIINAFKTNVIDKVIKQ